MFFTKSFLAMALSSLTLTLTLTLAHPSPPPQPFQVANLTTFEPSGRPESSSPYSVAFNVTDPNDEAVSTFCEARWPYAESTTGYPSHYNLLAGELYGFGLGV
ncbi:hypothetical protein P280DRAFT_550535 [Massarina eburnea CBS 473.64]|uniref:Uncharacterized protein n=1 Tax=Massarina eburnea CBS 473.64 TaxID=1395130 RepID=A0A6A6RWF2_9PLEO|nr:hypothetical protein P280DRAFT_550535 [Massarina eburnea CBS 473.64]